MGRVIVAGAGRMTVPSATISLSSIAEGTVVKINEDGSPVEFYVAKQDYESGLNGVGRVLVVRKDCYNTRPWNSSNVNAYASSAIDSWLNSDYKNLLDNVAQGLIGTTKFYYTPGDGVITVGTLERAVFLLSVTELGRTASYANTEGSALDIASSLQIAHMNGSAIIQWTRSPVLDGKISACALYTNGGVNAYGCVSSYGSRPCFTLPSTAKFDSTTLILKG